VSVLVAVEFAGMFVSGTGTGDGWLDTSITGGV